MTLRTTTTLRTTITQTTQAVPKTAIKNTTSTITHSANTANSV